MGSKRYKYKNIIVLLVSGKIQVGMPHVRKLNNKLGKGIVGKGIIPS